MSGKPLPRHIKNGRLNEADRGDVGASSPALDITNLDGGRTMPNRGVYGDSTSPVNPKQQSTWVPIGELASRIVRKAGAK